jgi:hypothetical protein
MTKQQIPNPTLAPYPLPLSQNLPKSLPVEVEVEFLTMQIIDPCPVRNVSHTVAGAVCSNLNNAQGALESFQKLPLPFHLGPPRSRPPHPCLLIVP